MNHDDPSSPSTAACASAAIFPAFKTNNIALCLGADTRYVPYLAVTLRSIIENADPSNNYDICILHENILPSLQRRILGMRQGNVSVRFVCIDGYINRSRDEIFYTCSHFTGAVYYRFYIPEIFEAYEKVLYLDCDVAVNRDVADLYNTALGENYLVGAVRDCEIIRWTNKDKDWGLSYFTGFLKIKNIFDYFQSGVILFNVEQCKKENVVEKLVSTLERIKEPNFPDQDILNIVCEGRVLFLDLRWNVEYHIPIWSPDWMQTMPAGILNDYMVSRKEPWIVHFAGGKKPWSEPSLEMSDYFWKYAGQTPFYEEILYENIKEATIKDNALKHQIDALQEVVVKQVRDGTDNALQERIATMRETVTQQIQSDADNALKEQVAAMKEDVTRQVRCGMDNLSKHQIDMIREALRLPQFRRKLKRVRLKIFFSFGTRKQRYIRRKQELKQKIKAIEKLIGGH